MNKTEFHKNDHSVPYNPVTTEYHRNSKGAALQQADHFIREKAAARAETIQQRSYSQPFNPITGERITPITQRLGAEVWTGERKREGGVVERGLEGCLRGRQEAGLSPNQAEQRLWDAWRPGLCGLGSTHVCMRTHAHIGLTCSGSRSRTPLASRSRVAHQREAAGHGVEPSEPREQFTSGEQGGRPIAPVTPGVTGRRGGWRDR